MLRGVGQLCLCVCRCVIQDGAPAASQLVNSSRYAHYQNPNTAVFERMHPIGLVGKDKYPRLKRRNYILNKIEYKPEDYKTTIRCILTKEIDGIGLKGSVVDVAKRLFRNDLYPRGDAIYASPENLAEYEEYWKNSEEEGIDYELKMTMKKLSGFHLRIFMNKDEPWELDATHVRVAFRQSGIMLKEDNLSMPETPISDYGDLVLELQINQRIKTYIRATIYPLVDGQAEDPDYEYPPTWGNEPVNPEEPLHFINRKTLNVDTGADER